MEKGSTGIILVIVVIAVAAYFLLNKTSGAIAKVNKSIKSTYSSAGTAEAVITNAAPALGTFLSKLAGGLGGGSSSARRRAAWSCR